MNISIKSQPTGITITVLILSVFISSFNSCTFFSTGNYQYIRIKTSQDSLLLENECKCEMDEGYYYLYGENKEQNIDAIIVFPATNEYKVIYIPHDYQTSITVNFKNEKRLYRCSFFSGSGKIFLENIPDSFFNQLSGNFEGKFVNVDNNLDTLTVENGEFLFYFSR